MDQNGHFSVVILAAGKGTRMKSAKAKVLHDVFGKPMLHHVLDAVNPLQPTRTVVIVGHQEVAVRKSLEKYNVDLVTQEQQLGTGHAVQMTETVIIKDDGLVMILCGDSPLIKSSSLQSMIDQHRSEQADLTVMTTILNNPTGYGRIISAGENHLAIVEEKECSDEQRKVKEINAGIYLVRRDLLFEALSKITPDNTQGEFYLTDIVQYMVLKGKKVQKCINLFPEEVLGVNSKLDLEAAHRELQLQRNVELMQQGVTMHNSTTISVSSLSEIGSDTLLKQNVQISGTSVIGSSCVIADGVIIKDCRIGDNAHIGAYSVLLDSDIEANTEVPPMSIIS